MAVMDSLITWRKPICPSKIMQPFTEVDTLTMIQYMYVNYINMVPNLLVHMVS